MLSFESFAQLPRRARHAHGSPVRCGRLTADMKLNGLSDGRRSRTQRDDGTVLRRRERTCIDHRPLIFTVARRQDETLGLVIVREAHGGGFGRVDFLPIHQGRLMQRRGRKFFTDGDIEKIRRDTEHEETQSTRCQRTSSRK